MHIDRPEHGDTLLVASLGEHGPTAAEYTALRERARTYTEFRDDLSRAIAGGISLGELYGRCCAITAAYWDVYPEREPVQRISMTIEHAFWLYQDHVYTDDQMRTIFQAALDTPESWWETAHTDWSPLIRAVA